MRRLLCAVLVALAPAAGAATFNTGAFILRRQVSSRATGLSGAMSAEDAGMDSVGINPAGTTGAKTPELLSTYSSGIADDAFGFLGYAHPLKAGVASAGFAYYDAGTVDIVPAAGAATTVNAERDYLGSLGWAMPLAAGLTVGGQAKYYRLSLAQTANASGFAGDVGAQWATPLKGVRLGAALQNLGPDVKFESTPDPLPMTARAGAAWTMDFGVAGDELLKTSTMMTLSADAVQVRGDATAAAAAGEFTLAFGPETSVTLRGSYLFNRDNAGVSFGAGLHEGRYYADYAASSQRDLGNVQNVSLRVRF